MIKTLRQFISTWETSLEDADNEVNALVKDGWVIVPELSSTHQSDLITDGMGDWRVGRIVTLQKFFNADGSRYSGDES